MQKIYTCKYCEKSFPSNEARNGHQNWCKSNPKSQQRKQNLSSKMAGLSYGTKPTKQKYNIQCTKCGKQFELELTQYLYDSGKYRKHCSRKCANSRTWTEQDKLKKSIANKNSQKHKLACLNNIKYEGIHLCPVCRKQFTTRKKHKRFCSRKCQNKGQQLGLFNITKPMGGYRKGSGIGKSGWYKGIYCDSSWQLAYVIYHLEHQFNIVRNKQKRIYIYGTMNSMFIYQTL